MAHPNKILFTGILTWLDTPSERSPCGARGRRVVLSRLCAESSVETLIGMGVSFGHGEGKIGVITEAAVKGMEVVIGGYVYARDFDHIVKRVKRDGNYGLSYEMADVFVPDENEIVWRIEKTTFTGVAIVKKHAAAYEDTSFRFIESDI